MDEQQRKAFKRAVERKSEEAEAASRASQEHPPGDAGGPGGTQPNLVSPAESQDSYDERAKGSRHGKVTADNWNQ
jgi:hypothetical protein